MSNVEDFKYIVYKRKVHVVKLGPLYVWATASATRSDCVQKAIKHFNVKEERFLKYKGIEIIQLYVKEIKVQET